MLRGQTFSSSSMYLFILDFCSHSFRTAENETLWHDEWEISKADEWQVFPTAAEW